MYLMVEKRSVQWLKERQGSLVFEEIEKGVGEGWWGEGSVD